MSITLGYVTVDLTNTSKQILFNLVSETIPEKDYFQSFDSGYEYINGNVCKKGHLTICYGIKNTDLKYKFEGASLKNKWQRHAIIKDVQVNLGYQGQYYIVLAIPEIKKGIFEFDKWIRNNNDIISEAPPFDSHITLCYIKNAGNFPLEILNKLKEKLIGKIVEFDSVNFYLPNEKGKINLSNL